MAYLCYIGEEKNKEKYDWGLGRYFDIKYIIFLYYTDNYYQEDFFTIF